MAKWQFKPTSQQQAILDLMAQGYKMIFRWYQGKRKHHPLFGYCWLVKEGKRIKVNWNIFHSLLVWGEIQSNGFHYPTETFKLKGGPSG